MTIEPLCNYLKKNNYTYKLNVYGDKHYFYNAPGYTYAAVEITLENIDINPLRAEIDKIQKYVKRYNLDIFHRSNIRFNYVTNKYDVFLAIRTPENKLESENYYYYLNECKNAIDNLIHEYYEKGIYHTKHKELNVKLRGIMDFYGEQYNDYLLEKAI